MARTVSAKDVTLLQFEFFQGNSMKEAHDEMNAQNPEAPPILPDYESFRIRPPEVVEPLLEAAMDTYARETPAEAPEPDPEPPVEPETPPVEP